MNLVGILKSVKNFRRSDVGNKSIDAKFADGQGFQPMDISILRTPPSLDKRRAERAIPCVCSCER